jgi:hypothetical protein
MAANMTDDLLNDDMDFMLSQVAENISEIKSTLNITALDQFISTYTKLKAL